MRLKIGRLGECLVGNCKLQPSFTGNFHLIKKENSFPLPDIYYFPEIQPVPNSQLMRISSSATQTISTQNPIHEPSQLPQPIKPEPSVFTTDGLSGLEDILRGSPPKIDFLDIAQDCHAGKAFILDIKNCSYSSFYSIAIQCQVNNGL